MHDNPYIEIHPNGAEIPVLRALQPVKAMPRIFRVHLQIERSRLDCLLFVAGQLGEAVGECVGDTEVHQSEEAYRASVSFDSHLIRRTISLCCPNCTLFFLRSFLSCGLMPQWANTGRNLTPTLLQTTFSAIEAPAWSCDTILLERFLPAVSSKGTTQLSPLNLQITM